MALNAFNVLNHENDTTFIGTITSPFFGRTVSTQPPRRMQLNLQFKDADPDVPILIAAKSEYAKLQ